MTGIMTPGLCPPVTSPGGMGKTAGMRSNGMSSAGTDNVPCHS